jgi:hypothetical protein
MKRFAWGAGTLSAAVGAVLAAVLVAPPAAAQSSTPAGNDDDGHNKCHSERSLVIDLLDAGTAFSPSLFRVATDREGTGFLNDSRNPGVWVNLDTLPGTPDCVVSADVAADSFRSQLYLNLLDKDGVGYQAVCTITGTPFGPTNLASACGPGFTTIPGTPVNG